MRRSSFLELAAVVSSLLIVVFVGFLAHKPIKQNVPITAYVMKDYYLYQKYLFYAFPGFEYFARDLIFHGFYNLLATNYTLTSCVAYHLKPDKPFELLTYRESGNTASYYFGIPFIPLNGTNPCFNDYVVSGKTELKKTFESFKDLQLDEDVDLTGLNIQIDPSKFFINISWKYDFNATNYERKLTIKNSYDYRLDVLFYDANLSKLYCNVSKLFNFYEVQNPEDFIDKYGKLKPMCEKLNISSKFINCTINRSLWLPYYVAYNISSFFNFTATLKYWCERFGGKLIGGDCKLPENGIGETYYRECIYDSNTIEVGSFSDIKYPNYTYVFYEIEKVEPDNKSTYKMYYPVTGDYISASATPSSVKSVKKCEEKKLTQIDPYLANFTVRYFVYYGKKLIYKKYTCKVGYRDEKTSCLSDPDAWIKSNIDGFYKKDPYYDSSTSCSNPDCCDYHYYRCGNATCCECVGWYVHYKQRVKHTSVTHDAYTLETFGCFEN